MGINKFLGFVWSAIAIILLIILIMGIRGRRFHFFNFGKPISFETGKLYSTDVFDADKIDSLDINLTSEAFVIKSHNEDVVKVELYCNEDNVPSIDVKNSTLSIESVHRSFSVSMMNNKVVVYVPYKKEFDKVDITLVSGSLHINDLNCAMYDGKTVSGSGHYENCKFESADIKQTSGSLHLRNVTADTLEADCISGSIHVEGEINGIDIKSSSGSVNVSLNNVLTKDSSVVSTSGSVRLYLPKKSDLNIDYHSNGSYNNNFTGAHGKSGTDRMGSGKVKLYLKTTSGSININ